MWFFKKIDFLISVSLTSLLYYFLSFACFCFILLFMVIMNNTALLWTVICTFLLQFRSVAQPCPTLCNPMDCSMPGLPVRHQLPELAETSVHLVGDAIQPSHPLASPSPPVFILSQHQGLSQWVSSSHQVATVLEFQLQHQSFQWIFRTDFLYDRVVWSPCCPRDSPESSSTPQFKSLNSLALSFLYSSILTSIHDYWKNYSFDETDLCW